MYATSSIRTQKTIGRVRRGSVWWSKQTEDLEKQDDDAPLVKSPRRKWTMIYLYLDYCHFHIKPFVV